MLFKLSYFVGPLAVCTAGLAAAQGPNLTSDTSTTLLSIPPAEYSG